MQANVEDITFPQDALITFQNEESYQRAALLSKDKQFG